MIRISKQIKQSIKNLQEILNLPASEKIDMVEQILESLNANDIELPKSQKNELDRRIALDDAGEMKWFSIEEVKSRLNNSV